MRSFREHWCPDKTYKYVFFLTWSSQYLSLLKDSSAVLSTTILQYLEVKTKYSEIPLIIPHSGLPKSVKGESSPDSMNKYSEIPLIIPRSGLPKSVKVSQVLMNKYSEIPLIIPCSGLPKSVKVSQVLIA